MVAWDGGANVLVGLLVLSFSGWLLLGRTRSPAAWPLALLLWDRGGFLLSSGLYSNPDTDWLGGNLIPSFVIASPFVVLHLALSLHAPLPRALAGWGIRWVPLGLLVAVEAGYWTRPSAFGPPATLGEPGPLALLVGVDRVIAALAALYLCWSHARVPPGPTRASLLLIGAAIALEPAYLGAFSASSRFLGVSLFRVDAAVEALWILALLPLALMFFVHLGLRRRRDARGLVRRSRWVLGGILFTIGVAFLLSVTVRSAPDVGILLNRAAEPGLLAAGSLLMVFALKRPDLLGLEAAERFQTERELGRGASGRTVLARDVLTHRRVVLKEPLSGLSTDGKTRARFLREARLLQRLRHPNIISLLGVQEREDSPILVLEYLDGGSLEDRLRRVGPLGPPETVRLGIDVLNGLERAHAAGIIHRDLKPANILLSRRGAAKVSDFGVALPPQGSTATATIAAPGHQPGSPAYMSPEQARGDDVDARSDLFSVGVVLYQCLYGRHYVDLQGKSEFQIRHAIQEAAPRFPRGRAPKALTETLRRALALRAEDRFPDAASMRRALESSNALPSIVASVAGSVAAAPAPSRAP